MGLKGLRMLIIILLTKHNIDDHPAFRFELILFLRDNK